jgi:hypothetical protein
MTGFAGNPPAAVGFVAALYDPERVLRWDLQEWDLALRQARRLRLLARLAARLEDTGLSAQLPTPVQRHLLSATRQSAWRMRTVDWAAERVGQILAPLDVPLLLLKGAAYQAQGLGIAQGRMPSDLDIMVPADALESVRRRLAEVGWSEVELNEHDRDYYLRWSHELPPMHHPVLAVELDVHHNIVPDTRRSRVDASALVDGSVVSPRAPWRVLSPVDQILHSAAHLVLDADPADRLRDLVDLEGLVGALPPDGERCLHELGERARRWRVHGALTVALHLAAQWLGSPALRAASARLGPPRRSMAWPDATSFGRLLAPDLPERADSVGRRFARWSITWRHHGHRLPPLATLQHFWHRLRASS